MKEGSTAIWQHMGSEKREIFLIQLMGYAVNSMYDYLYISKRHRNMKWLSY